MRNLITVAAVLLTLMHTAKAQTVAIDPADLPYVTALLHKNSHETVTAYLEDVGHYDGAIKLPNDTVYAVTFDSHMQVFCGKADGSISLKSGDVVALAGKVLIEDNVFVMQTCSLRLATPYEREIHSQINR